MEIKLDKSTVEQAVADAIVNSAIGDHIKKAVDEMLSKGWDSPIRKAVEQMIMTTALKMVQAEYADRIKEAVKVHMTEAVLNETVLRMWDEVWKRQR